MDRETILLTQLKAVNRAVEAVFDMAGVDRPYENISRRNALLAISQELQEKLIEISKQA
jgi:hypothetical protein